MVSKVWDAPEIWAIGVPLPENPLRNLNAYVVRTPAGSLVVDTGFNRPECRAALWAGIGELGLDMASTSLFLTHLHSDHIGLAQDFADRGCPVYMNGIDYDYFCRIQAGKSWPQLEALYLREGFPAGELARQAGENQARIYAPSRPFPAKRVADHTKLHLGALELECLHTPGHSPGHSVLYLPQAQLLFSGDHILFDITPNISVWLDVPHSLADYLDSLEKIAALPVRAAFPAHRGARGDVKQRAAELRAHHLQRLDEIAAVVAAAPGASAYTAASRTRWSARGRPWADFPPHQKWFAVGETLAHLYHLAGAGRLARDEGGDIVRYFPAAR